MIEHEQVDDWRLEVVDEVGSTSDVVAARARGGEAAGLAVLARRQNAARGSRGRTWQEPPVGNLAITVLRRPDVSVGAASETVFVAALAVIETLDDAIGAAERLVLKWPNDVLVERPADTGAPSGKVAGILVETEADATTGRLAWLTIGVGVNLAAAPAGVAGAAALAGPGRPPRDPVVVARRLLGRLGHWEWVAARDGFAAVRRAWLERAHASGTPLLVTNDGQPARAGLFAGIDARGALLLRRDGRVETISTGAVLLGATEAVPCCS